MAAASPFRFFNAALKPVYDSCLLPVERPLPSAPNALELAAYSSATVHSAPDLAQSACRHRVHVPPEGSDYVGTSAELSGPFAAYGTQAGAHQSSVKRRKRELNGHLRVYAVRMFPTAEQTVELKRCFAASRHAYNATVASINGGERANYYERRAEYMAAEKPDWSACVHATFKKGGVEQAVNAFQTNYAKMRVNPSHTHFEVRFMSHRKTRTEVIRVEGDGTSRQKHSPLLSFKAVPFNSDNRAECLAHFGCNLESVGGIRLQDKSHVIQKLLAEGRRLTETCKIRWDKRTRAFHFLYTHEIPRLEDPDPEFETKRIVATDPGVRRFQTFYSPTSGEVGVLLHKQRAEMERRCFDIDKRTSWLAKRRDRERQPECKPRSRKQRQRTVRGKRRRLAKERVRLHQWMKFTHYDAANALLESFDLVIAPKLATQDMVPRNGRVFGAATARAMYTWSHGLFTQRLESAAARYAGRCVLTTLGEPGTSKTCAHCGKWDAGLGGAARYECARCGACYDRDVGGARNNFMAAFGIAVGIGWDGQGGN